jgi:uncharacterized OB-fold protein
MCSDSDVAQRRITETKLEFPYSRTVGPVVGGFLAGLRDRQLKGVRGPDGRVLVPPVEFEPSTGARLSDLVDVGPEATVESWTWVASPTAKHPLDHPFAFALVKPDGADTAMVHAVDAGSIEEMATGMRVRPRWREEPTGMITDIEAWEPA